MSEERDVHTEHCCIKHGCKYGEPDECTVCNGTKTQSYPCEYCREDECIDYEQEYHEERKARYAAQSELVTSQARLSEAVKVLQRIAANYEGGATFSGTQCADIASDFLATLGEEK